MNARKVIVVGPDELEHGQVVVRDMVTHEERTASIEQSKQLLSRFSGDVVDDSTFAAPTQG